MKRNELKQNKKRGASETGSSTKLPPVNPKQAVPLNFSLNSLSQQQESLIGILHEYFMKNNYLETLQSFQRDCCKQNRLNARNQEEIKKQLLALFDQGQKETFFQKFSQFVPLSLRTKDMQTMKLEFYIQIYFFIYSIHPFLGKKKNVDLQAKQYFAAFLEGRGSVLSKSPQFLQFYALTNLQKPQQHPIFKILFTKEWVTQFRKRISYFFQKLYPSGKIPVLITMYDRFIDTLQKQAEMFPHEQDQLQILQQIEQQNNQMNPEPVLLENPNQSEKKKHIQKQATFKGDIDQIEILKANIEQLQEEKDSLFQHLEGERSKSQHWQNIYHQFSEAAQNIIMESQKKWFQITQQIYSITDEILSVCKKMKDGIPLNQPDIIDKISLKLGKYEKFMKMKIEEIIQGENFDFSVFTPAGEDDSVMLNRIGKGSKLIQLDFAKIHECLNQPEVPKGGEAVNKAVWQSKILLLQALKWRINKAKSTIAKRQAVLSYTIYDILGLTKQQDKTLQILINSENQDLALQTIGFINALTKDYYGRQYLVCQKLYRNLVTIFSRQNLDEQTNLQLLFSLQICSTKKLAQQLMIKFDMVRIIVKKLQKQRQSLQPRYLEYLVALLLNILLHAEGPKKAEEINGEIMMTLINLIQCENMQIRSLIHGCLYPLLNHQIFRNKAKEFGLLENIKFLLENKQTQQHQNQLSYLKGKLQKDQDEPQTQQQKQQSEDDYDTDQFFSDEYKEEIEDYPEISISGIKGQQLLMKQFALLGPESLTQRSVIQDKVTETLKRKSIMMDNSFYERESVNTPLLNNKLRRNISNNNSVYSNKSSNRVLRSQMNSRSQVNTNPNIPLSPAPPQPGNRFFKQKLDTVHQNNSQVSIKDYEQKLNPSLGNLEQTFRKNEVQQPLNNVSGGQSNQVEQQSMPNVNTYQNTNQYRNIFQTRSKLVRTPPRK